MKASSAQGPVDDHFPMSVGSRTISFEGTTQKVGPDRSGNSMWSGPRPTKGTTGLMPIVDGTNDAPPPPSCPLCNQGARKSHDITTDLITTASFICEGGHLYQLRWLTDGVA